MKTKKPNFRAISYGVRDFSPAFDEPIYWPESACVYSGSGINPAVKSGTEVPHSTKSRPPAYLAYLADLFIDYET